MDINEASPATEVGRALKAMPLRDLASARLVLGLTLLLLVLGLLRWSNFSLFNANVFPVWVHTVLELLAIMVSLLVVASVWLVRLHDRLPQTLLLGAGFLCVALLDLGHLLSYPGMPDFITPASPQKSITFWLCARYVAALLLLTLALHPVRAKVTALGRRTMLAASIGIAAACYASALWFPQIWPPFFVEGQGLTAVKVAAEYLLILLLSATALLLMRKRVRARFNSADLATAVVITILSELCLTLYTNVNDTSSLLGHVYKAIAYYFIYRAVYVVSVQEPYRLLNVEIDEHKRTEARLEILAHHDPLTGLPNRVMLHDRIEQAMAHSRRDSLKFAVVLMDLDQFKHINDSLGHAAGDIVLSTVAERLRSRTRETDTVCRLGGDEFLMLICGLHNKVDVIPILSSLQSHLGQPMTVAGTDMRVSASFGVALFPDDGIDLDTLHRQADIAMYRAKDSGRNTYRFFDSGMHHEGLERMQVQHGLARALAAGEFELQYQPQIDLASGRMVGAEALLRWRRSDGKLMPPAEFIPVAEQSGLIVPIGAWVLQEACRQAAIWHAQRGDSPGVAVNLSALQFRQGDIEATVQAALKESGLPAHKLELELTESILISDPVTVLATVVRLKALGVKLAIDDFGTGYSSLAYLSRFPVDKLKIDRSFLREMGSARHATVIVEAILGLCRSLDLISIAEGVETEAAASQLRAMGCSQAQGYWFARPMPAAELQSFLLLAIAPA